MGDGHLALHCALHPAYSRRHSARSLERGGVLPETTVGEVAGDPCELYIVGQSEKDAFQSSSTRKRGHTSCIWFLENRIYITSKDPVPDKN